MANVSDLIIGGASIGSANSRPSAISFGFEGGMVIQLEGDMLDQFWQEFMTYRTLATMFIKDAEEAKQQKQQEQQSANLLTASEIRRKNNEE